MRQSLIEIAALLGMASGDALILALLLTTYIILKALSG